jgi:transposase
LIRRLTRGHHPDDRRSTTQQRARHAVTDHHRAIKSNYLSTTQPNTTPKWTPRWWPARYAESGIEGLHGIPHPGKPRTHDERVRSRIVAVSRMSPPQHTGLSHWSSRGMAKYLKRHEGIEVSHVFVADLWREHGLKPHRQDTFKLQRIRSSPKRSPTSSAYTWLPRRQLWCCGWTSSPESKPWTVPSRCFP